MKKFTSGLVPIYTFLAIALSSCEVIGGIFKAGVWVGIIVVIIVVVIIFWIISKVRNR
jgi:hypothetical protein